MEILQKGEYPENNIRECEDCHCVFKYYNSEINIETSSVLEQETFCGFGITKYVKCPQCNHKNILSCNFYEDPSWLDALIDNIKSIKIKFKKKEGKKNGKN